VAFKGVTDLTSREIITYAASQPTLNDANFFVVLSPEATAAWDHVFTALEAYGRDLVLLTSPDLTQDYKDSAVNLAQQVQQTGEHLKGAGVFGNSSQTPTLLATAFTKLGDLLLKARAHAEAKKILLATDPVVTDVFGQMAGAVGDSHQTGLRGTVFEHWEQIKGGTRVAFLKAVQAGDGAARLALANEFVDLISQQQAQDLSLASLRRSFLTLARVHREMAQGNNVSAAQAVNETLQELADTKALYERFKAIGDNAGKSHQ